MINKNYKRTLDKCSKEMIISDGIFISNYMNQVKDPILSMALLPFYALYCRAAVEFLGVEETSYNTYKEIKDIRNDLKAFSGNYAKSKNNAIFIDKEHSKLFQKNLRFRFLAHFNLYYNIGVYLSDQNKILSNTQLLLFYLINPQKVDTMFIEKIALSLGENIGKDIGDILNSYFKIPFYLYDKSITFLNVPKYGHQDFNTNKNNRFFPRKIDKGTTLILLHLLSSISSIKNLYLPTIPGIHSWSFRVLYNAAHYVWSGIKSIKNHFEQDRTNNMDFSDATPIIEKGKSLFPSSFRNCMMHYGLVNKDTSAITEDKFDISLPFYGLVESCFCGKSFYEYYNELLSYTAEIETYLSSFFTVNPKQIKWD